jgi:hypothetical protein
MSAECDIHGTNLLWDNDGDGPTYCPSCHLDTLTAQRERLLTQLEKAADDLAGIVTNATARRWEPCDSSAPAKK